MFYDPHTEDLLDESESLLLLDSVPPHLLHVHRGRGPVEPAVPADGLPELGFYRPRDPGVSGTWVFVGSL